MMRWHNVVVAACAAVVMALPATAADLAAELLSVTGGARTKLVWGRDEKAVMLFDTAEAEPRVLVDNLTQGVRSWPIITPDGEQVIFNQTDWKAGSGNLYVVPVGGGTAKLLRPGLCALGVWTDPMTGRVWVTYSAGKGKDNRSGYIRRFPLDAPDRDELVWDKSDSDAPVSMSADGRYAAGQFPWPDTSVVTWPNGRRFVAPKRGCNTNIAPDNSYRVFHVDFDHKGLYVYPRLLEGDSTATYIRLPVDGKQVHRARYTNHPQLITYYGPMSGVQDVFVARFNPAFDGLEATFRLKAGEHNDDLPYAWIDPAGVERAYPLGQFIDEAPLTVELTHRDATADTQWRMGDAALKGQRVRHTLDKPGQYAIEATIGGRTLTGRALVRAAEAPKITQVDVLGGTVLQVTMSEPVELVEPAFSLGGLGPIADYALDLDGRKLTLQLPGLLKQDDVLTIRGVQDLAQRPNALATSTVPVRRPPWPSRFDDIVALWSAAAHFHLDPRSKDYRPLPLDPNGLSYRGRSLFDRFGRLLIGGKAWLRTRTPPNLVADAIAKGSRQVSVEVVFQPAAVSLDVPEQTAAGKYGDRVGVGYIVASWREPGEGNFFIGQRGDKIVAMVSHSNRPQEISQRIIELATITDLGTRHVVLTFEGGRILGYLDGREVYRDDNAGSLAHWGGGELCLGNYRHYGMPNWYGKLDAAAIYSRALGPAEVKANFDAYQQVIERRGTAPQVVLDAELIARTTSPTVEQIAPYEHALVVNEYKVLKVLHGQIEHERLRVAEWGVWDRKVLKSERQLKPGTTQRLILERWDDNPAMQKQLLVDTLEPDVEAQVLFRVEDWIDQPGAKAPY